MTFYSLNEAQKIMLDCVQPISRVESVSIFDANARILAEDLFVSCQLPSFDNSAMDGYAIRSSSIGKKVRVVSSTFAGDSKSRLDDDLTTIKVMTGAPVPELADLVVPFEDAVIDGDMVSIPADLKLGAHIRKAGEELQKGALLFAKGVRLDPAKIALIASQGVMAVRVYERVKVTVVSGGDEVVEPWQVKTEYQIYNSNSTALVESIKRVGFVAHYASIGKDQVEKLAASFQNALDGSDVVITTGGVSVGEADFTRKALESIGATIRFHGLNIKPGKPTMFATVDKKIIIALPGNPLSALANFHLLVLPTIFKLQGANEFYNDLLVVKNGEDLTIKSNRDVAIFGTVSAGRFIAFNGGKYGSNMLTPIAQSNAIALFGAKTDLVKKGAEIKVVPLNYPQSGEFLDPINV